jgi:molybdenum cofactor cytidylyltransferase
VLRPEQSELQMRLVGESVQVLIDRAPDGGMGSSLAHAVRSSPEAIGWLVALADMPFVKSSTLCSVVEALRSGAEIAAPVYRGRRGHPVGFSKRWFAELSNLQGDVGARRLIENHPLSITFVEVDDPGIHRDVDTPDDVRFD